MKKRGKRKSVNERLEEISAKLSKERTSMSNERTMLAYVRTSLASFLFGVAIMKLFEQPSWSLYVGTFAIAFGFAFLIVGFVNHYRRVYR